MDSNNQQQIANTNDVSVNDLAKVSLKAIKYLKTKSKIILVISIIGGGLGLCYSFLKKPTYTAVCTFVLEDSKGGGGLGQYAGIASLAGINIGGGGGGIFEGDNILELYKSRSMIEKALLTTCTFNKKKELLITRFIDSYKLRNNWKKEEGLTNINFYGDPDKFNRKQDSIVTDLVELFNKNFLSVTKLDKKLSIIYVQFVTKDELFSKYFTEKLVENVNDFYIQTKTKKAYQNVEILQRQADSVRAILNSSINGVANALDAAPNANPQMSTLRVLSQKKQVDVQTNSAIYAEIVKNLEIAKVSLRQEQPLIQVIDKPVLPLHIEKAGKIKSAIIGFLLGFIFIAGVLVVRRIFKIKL